jgi:hypothetical protein
MTADIHAGSTPSPRLSRLEFLIGTWEWNGRSKSGSFEVHGSDAYEWLDGGFFLVERHDLVAGGKANRGIAIYGFDESRDACVAHYFDNDGTQGIYEIDVRDGELRINWERYRFVGRILDDGKSIAGTWEQAPDGSSWEYWYDLEMTKQ